MVPSTYRGSNMPGIDFQAVRQAARMQDVLDLLHFAPTASRGAERRGPCPVHRSEGHESRAFCVNLAKHAYQCFQCGSKGNQLDLWANAHGTKIGSKQTAKTCRLEVSVVGKRLVDAQTTHDHERDMIDDARLRGVATVESRPGVLDFLYSRLDQQSLLKQVLAGSVDSLPVRAPSRRVPAFPKDEWRRYQAPSLAEQILVSGLRCGMPLVAYLPRREQTNGVQEHDVHG